MGIWGTRALHAHIKAVEGEGTSASGGNRGQRVGGNEMQTAEAGPSHARDGGVNEAGPSHARDGGVDEAGSSQARDAGLDEAG